MHVPAGGVWGNGPSMAGGYVTLGFGGNLGLGGSSSSPFGFSSDVPNATVTVDGKTIISKGAITSS